MGNGGPLLVTQYRADGSLTQNIALLGLVALLCAISWISAIIVSKHTLACAPIVRRTIGFILKPRP